MKKRFLLLTIQALAIFILAAACSAAEGPVAEEPTELSYPYPKPTLKVVTQVPYPEGYPAQGEGPIDISKLRPASGDDRLATGTVYIEFTDILLLESYPVQVRMQITGSLPTPCHELRVDAGEPDAENRIHVAIYSVSDPDVDCIQVLEPFDITIPLGNYTEGKFAVMLNGEQTNEFELP